MTVFLCRDGLSALHIIASHSPVRTEYEDDFTVIAKLIEKGANLDDINPHGNSVIHAAAENCNLKMVDFLLEYPQNFHSVNEYGNSLLHTAVTMGHPGLAEKCLQEGASMEAVNKYNETPLAIAVKYDHPELIEVLAKFGAAIDEPMLFESIYYTGLTYTFLSMAASYGNVQSVKALLKLGANMQNGLIWVNPNHPLIALREEHVQIAHILIQHGFVLNLLSTMAKHQIFDLLSIPIGNDSKCAIAEQAATGILMELLSENAITPIRASNDILIDMPFYEFNLEVLEFISPKKIYVMFLCGFRFKIFCDIFTQEFEEDTMDSWRDLALEVRHPLTLQQLCRIAIRCHLGAPLSTLVGKLALPTFLKNYLKIPELKQLLS